MIIKLALTGLGALVFSFNLVKTSRYFLYFFIGIFSLGNVYLTGLFLSFSLALLTYPYFFKRQYYNSFLLFFVLLWAILIVIQVLNLNLESRSFQQIIEFLVYVYLILGVSFLVQTGEQLLFGLLNTFLVSAVVLSFYLLAVSFVFPGWPDWLIGKNEASFVIAILGYTSAIYLFLEGRLRKRYLVPVLVLFLFAFSMLESRAATYVGYGLTMLLIGYMLLKRSKYYLIPVAIAACFVIFETDIINDKVDSLLDTQSNYSNQERFSLLSASYELMRKKPYIGWGWGTIDQLLPFYAMTDVPRKQPHNTYANFAVEMGGSGIALLVSLFLYLFFISFMLFLRKQYNNAFYVFLVFVTTILLAMTTNIFYGASRGVPYCLVYGVCIGIYMRKTGKIGAVNE